MRKENEEITLQALWDMYLPRLWIVALVAVVCAALFGAYTLFIKKDTYTSTVDVYTYGNEDGNTSSSDLTYAKSMIDTFNEYFRLVDFRQHVKNKLDEKHPGEYPDLTIEDLLDMVAVSQKGKTEFFAITVVSEDKQLSEDIAEIICDELEGKLAELPQSAKIQCFPPNFPEEPDEKETLMNILIGFVVGIVLSIVAIFLIVRFDTTIRSKKKLEDSFDLPILGVIPGISAEAKASQQ